MPEEALLALLEETFPYVSPPLHALGEASGHWMRPLPSSNDCSCVLSERSSAVDQCCCALLRFAGQELLSVTMSFRQRLNGAYLFEIGVCGMGPHCRGGRGLLSALPIVFCMLLTYVP